MKWSFSHFDYKGMMCSMAAFKGHCTLTGATRGRRRSCEGAAGSHWPLGVSYSKSARTAGFVTFPMAFLGRSGTTSTSFGTL
jgi:hypothetical protein